jgi:hypothetical protein
MAYGTDIAKEFKARNNESFIGIVVGTVISTNPLSVSIYNGGAIFTGDNLYVCKGATERTTTIGSITYTGLLINDKVAVIATQDNQSLFVIDKLE